MALALMPSRDQASAMARVSCVTPALVAPYAIPPGKARVVWREAKLTTLPHPFALIAGTSACVRKNGAARLRFMVISHPSAVTSSAVSRVLMPAAWTMMSGGPKGAQMSCAICPSAPRSERSAATAAAGMPVRSTQSFSASARRATPTTRAPASASTSAARCPRPEEAPVTHATRPRRSKRAQASRIGGEVEIFAGEVFGQPHIGRAGVAFHPFQTRDPGRGNRHIARAFPRRLLPSDDLHVFVHRQATGVARRTRGGQHMVGARGLVAV
mmetsp:Transcript_817/g.1529  ORF Transcript_817/g.1529 Transcript_817/m.1529 type:complete len:270 (+) Transcript_817:508-1317(+)